ncbi:immunoglobulin-like domain-containing protein, partial [Paraclostridium sordellii]
NQQDNTYDKLNTFPDKNKVSNWAKPYIEGAIENGYLRGDNLNNLRPTSQITRAESVTLLSRIENDDIKALIEDNNKFPRLRYHYVTYSLVKGDRWDNNMINATAIDREYNPLEVNYEGNVDTNTPGFYKIKISATDGDGNTNSEDVYVEVEDAHLVENRYLYPQVISKVLRLKKGDAFDYKMLEATSFDADEKDITNTITYKGEVDTSKRGRYPIFISAKDSKGLVSTLLVFVYVQ